MITTTEINTRPTRWAIPKERDNNRLVVIVFSRNRPLQLDLCLNSLLHCCVDTDYIAQLFVIYRNDKEYDTAFNTLINEHPEVSFVAQSNFKEDVVRCLDKRDFVLFITDDTIFCNDFSIQKITEYLDKYERTLGFSLRLSYFTYNCYPLDRRQRIPHMKHMEHRISMYMWPPSDYDFAYPLEVSSSVYRTADILGIIEGQEFYNPNDLERVMYMSTPNFVQTKPYLFCYNESAAFANPVNRVQSVALANKFGNNPEYSSENLLTVYENGGRIDYSKFYGIIPNGAHMEIDLL